MEKKSLAIRSSSLLCSGSGNGCTNGFSLYAHTTRAKKKVLTLYLQQFKFGIFFYSFVALCFRCCYCGATLALAATAVHNIHSVYFRVFFFRYLSLHLMLLTANKEDEGKNYSFVIFIQNTFNSLQCIPNGISLHTHFFSSLRFLMIIIRLGVMYCKRKCHLNIAQSHAFKVLFSCFSFFFFFFLLLLSFTLFFSSPPFSFLSSYSTSYAWAFVTLIFFLFLLKQC